MRVEDQLVDPHHQYKIYKNKKIQFSNKKKVAARQEEEEAKAAAVA